MPDDISIKVGDHIFNLRVGALIVRDGRLLTCRFEGELWCFLPGGRVRAGETTDAALLRELDEELGLSAQLTRPVFVIENFFESGGSAFHELGMYFAADLSGAPPTSVEDGGRRVLFEWLPLNEVSAHDLRPAPLREQVAALPSELTRLVCGAPASQA